MRFTNIRLACIALLLLVCSIAQMLYAQPPQRIQSVTVQPDSRVIFKFNDPNAASVSVDGSYPITTKANGKMIEVPMAKDDKGIWTATVGPLKPDIYEYHFDLGGGMHVTDPSNTAHLRGDSNWFIVPGPESADYEVNDVPHGRVSYDWYPSPTLNMASRRMTIYTPPGYQTGTTRYPVLYLLHWGGGDETGPIGMLHMPEIMDNLIAQGKVVPMIVVMGNSNPKQVMAPGDTPLPGPNEPGGTRAEDNMLPYDNSIVHDIIPYIDKNYRTQADRDHRAIAGFSLGATHALLTAFANLDQFSWLGSMSGGLDALPNLYIKIIPPADAGSRRGAPVGQSIDPVKFAGLFPVLGPGLNTQLHLFYIGIGDDDGLLEGWQAARKVFDEKGVKYKWNELPHYGHDGSTWRVMLLDFLPQLFKPAR